MMMKTERESDVGEGKKSGRLVDAAKTSKELA